MEQSEFVSSLGKNALMAFFSVLIILGAIVSTSYLISLNNNIIFINLATYLGAFVMLYIGISKIPTLFEFFITEKITFEKNLGYLIYAQLLSWTIIVGLDIILFLGVWFLSGTDDPLLQAIGKIIVLSLIATAFFIYTKREDIKKDTGVEFGLLLKYCLMGFAFGFSTYSIGGIIVISSELIGWGLTITGIGLEIFFTSIYTYMDIQDMVRDYKQRQISKAEWEEKEQRKEEDKEIALRVSGKYDL
jgi:hypothetical protein